MVPQQQAQGPAQCCRCSFWCMYQLPLHLQKQLSMCLQLGSNCHHSSNRHALADFCTAMHCVIPGPPCRVIVPDLPAHGARFAETPLTLDNAVDTLASVIQQEARGEKVGQLAALLSALA